MLTIHRKYYSQILVDARASGMKPNEITTWIPCPRPKGNGMPSTNTVGKENLNWTNKASRCDYLSTYLPTFVLAIKQWLVTSSVSLDTSAKTTKQLQHTFRCEAFCIALDSL
eukprot:scaffold1169_cov120-Cylindrotheca_fusiformis.AAC.6